MLSAPAQPLNRGLRLPRNASDALAELRAAEGNRLRDGLALEEILGALAS